MKTQTGNRQDAKAPRAGTLVEDPSGPQGFTENDGFPLIFPWRHDGSIWTTWLGNRQDTKEKRRRFTAGWKTHRVRVDLPPTLRHLALWRLPRAIGDRRASARRSKRMPPLVPYPTGALNRWVQVGAAPSGLGPVRRRPPGCMKGQGLRPDLEHSRGNGILWTDCRVAIPCEDILTA